MAGSRLRQLEEEVRRCTRCPLHATRTHAVPGEGPGEAGVMVVGEAPGRMEDRLGRPFVGPAGKLLDSLLELAGLSRGEVYITNVVKCRPPGNRDPREEEIEACLPYLVEQISLIRPRLVIAVGRHAGRTLFRLAGLRWPGLARARGRVWRGRIGGVELLIAVTYHPAAALYNPGLRGELERDFSGFIRRSVAEALSRGGGGGGAGLDRWFSPDSRGPGEGAGGDVDS
ncbi:uracil-DNA glycosylase [Aeropyrum pernix K1]|uniref:Type-4 uracil-DNA glycosylase n=1 Tax=Aeropyrum pernix (strain ATCC 700893 / DSM 11879 / JCM 9820 / NBRC 100138 / K1) TaxID=272557 RepID=Q9YF11_AERPE|nr:type-4 uracil-DNA glycosylase [Aeropyrum pernix]BAA79385.2 uracil-DNA glycosylase [Aeropyrum pernix K1]